MHAGYMCVRVVLEMCILKVNPRHNKLSGLLWFVSEKETVYNRLCFSAFELGKCVLCIMLDKEKGGLRGFCRFFFVSLSPIYLSIVNRKYV